MMLPARNGNLRMKSFTYWRGATLAILLAGPCMLAVITLNELLFPEPPITQGGFTVGPLVAVPIAVVVGVPSSAIPVLAGGWTMGALGRSRRWARHPASWALAGAILSWPLALFFDKGSVPIVIAQFALTGAICALVVRFGTRWSDPGE
ncbi:hypothetical protein [Sphingomonas sp.]|uniref:hypothetical protein n=1 Tax=Sphingomonas sp. TaxID=28214 RepID=UPI001EB1F57F|nr:hypothetical protein [Sphingomonas sp.]MBX3594071.1 hypothetical protein [Sphingomonas sp.]